MTPTRLIAFLNSLSFGDLGAITTKLEEARVACLNLEQPELAAKIDDASTALRSADVKTYRRSLETVVSKLGHLK